ncbi:hypothetical protein F383_33562 [Gossypium arboreum]|uniref:Uncharacterized protein n=1 Tax=Gossypium arboreum TaxID=29729 RepID=A0A0B0PQ24_GOSAR|nr:hypothetical protein F383_33562 [Gossypium arboreum]
MQTHVREEEEKKFFSLQFSLSTKNSLFSPKN